MAMKFSPVVTLLRTKDMMFISRLEPLEITKLLKVHNIPSLLSNLGAHQDHPEMKTKWLKLFKDEPSKALLMKGNTT